MTWTHPAWLLGLIPLALAVALLSRRLVLRMAPWPVRAVVRFLLLALVFAVLAGPYRPWPVALPTRVVVVVDQSDALSAEDREVALARARAVLEKARADGHQVTLIHSHAPGQSARGMPDDASPLVPGAHADLPRALAQAGLSFAAREAGHVHVIAHGLPDPVATQAATEALRQRGITLSAVSLPDDVPLPAPEPQIEAVDLPGVARGPFRSRAAFANVATGGHARLLVDGEEVERMPVPTASTDAPSPEVISKPLTLAPGLHEITWVYEDASGQARTRARNLVQVERAPRAAVLIRDGGHNEVARALQTQGIEVHRSASAEVDLVAVDVGGLVGLDAEARAALFERVAQGLGLLVFAGRDDNAWETLARDPVRTELPLAALPKPPEPPPTPPTPPDEPEPQPPEKPKPPIDKPEPDPEPGPGIRAERRPEEALPITLVLVIDRSGSMAANKKLELAIEGARRAAERLAPTDRIAVISFADDARIDLMPVRVGRVQALGAFLESRIRATPSGRTNISAALGLAAQVFDKQRRKNPIRHLMLLTDGEANVGSTFWPATVAPFARAGVTLTAIGIGPSHSARELRQIVQYAAVGHYRSARDVAELPTVMVRDTREIADKRKQDAEALNPLPDPERKPREEPPEADKPTPPPPPPAEPETPAPPPPTPPEAPTRLPLRLLFPHEATRGLDESKLPLVEPARRSRPTPATQILAVRKSGEAVLAAQRRGLGRVLMWVLPADDPGARRWPEFGQVVAQMARAAMAPRGSLAHMPEVWIHAREEGSVAHVAWPRGLTSGSLMLRWEAGDQREEIGPFLVEDPERRLRLPTAAPGTLAKVVPVLDGNRSLPPTTWLVPAPRPRPRTPGDAAALAELFGAARPVVTWLAQVPRPRDERREPLWTWCLWAAAALLPLDVLLHRRRSP